MSLSSTASKQRDRQTRFSHPLFAWGIVGSLAFHGGVLPAILLLSRNEAPPEPAEIEIVFTEPVEPIPEEEPEPAVFEEEVIEETPVLSPESELSAPPEVVEEVSEDVVDAVSEPDTVVDERPSRLDDLLANIRRRRPSRTSGNSNPATPGNGSTPSSTNNSGGGEVAARPAPAPPRPAPRTVACRSCPKPSYPSSALNAGIEGTINIMVDINANGNVTSATLVGSSGNSALDRAALSTVRNRWRFQPIRGGASGVVVSVVMTIQGSDLNRRAREGGDRESVEIPSPDIATEEDNSDSSTASTPSEETPLEESSDTPSNTQNDGAQTNAEPDNASAPITESTSPEPSPAPASAPAQPASVPEPAPAPESTSEAPEAQSDAER
ncbi:MAG: TonB family protein [Cyanobacteria bacterium P01_E01_bin.6]